jgi:zinc transport system permease protein
MLTAICILQGAIPQETHWLDTLLKSLASLAQDKTFFSYHYNLRALLALVLASLACGAVGSLVVGGRMAFFSDALAHCSLAGVSIGFVMFTVLFASSHREQFWDWVTPVVVGFAMLTGYGIASVRERTGLASDTVIGIFLATAMGLAAVLRKLIASRRLFNLEDVLFGEPLKLLGPDILWLAALVALVAVTLFLIYNYLMLAGFSGSLALSRRVPARLASYAFVVLLALVVSLCVRTVGILLINTLLVVPAATACNLTRNLRQVFWWTIILCLVASVLGQGLAWEIEARFNVPLGISGAIVLVNVTLFIGSTVVGPWLRRAPQKT